MDIISSHIKNHLSSLIETPDSGFDQVFIHLQNGYKDKCKSLLIYFDKLINQSLNQNESKLKYIHFHFDRLGVELFDMLAEFISIKFFFLGLVNDVSDRTNENIAHEINRTDNALRKPLHLPEGVKGGSRQDRLLKEDRINLRKRKIFYEEALKIQPKASFQPQTLLNLPRKEFDRLFNLFKAKPVAISTDDIGKNESYVLLNCDKSRDHLDQIMLDGNRYLLDGIQNIIILDCEEKQTHRILNYNELSAWNENGTNFKNLMIISGNSRVYNFNKLKNRLDRIHSRYHSETQFPNFDAFTITFLEVNHLLGKNEEQEGQVDFFGEEFCSFWDDFRTNIRYYEELYELHSYKMMNIYSLVLSEEIKELILKDIFSFPTEPRLISKETVDILKELSSENLRELEYCLKSTFDWILMSGWREHLKNEMRPENSIILPELIKNNNELVNEISIALGLTKKNKITTWFDLDHNFDGEITILDYRDFGPFPYVITPNITESTFIKAKAIKSTFLAIFFKNKFQWMKFNYTRDVIKLLHHPLRERFFRWNDLNDANKRQKPTKEDNTNWDAEQSYQIDRETSCIRLTFADSTRRTFHFSELFIKRQDSAKELKVSRIEDIIDEDLNNTSLEIQLLDELQNEFNIYEKIANVQKEENELQVIRKNYGLDKSEGAGRLWKILLRQKALEVGIDQFYEEIKSFMELKGLRLVSRNTFENSWINPSTFSLLPREKKVFLRLCEYLQLPKAYFRIMLRLKNAEIQSTRDSSKQMNNLLSDLINDGCFDEGSFPESILCSHKQKYLKRHDFDEIGIAEDEVVSQLNVLVELLTPYIKLSRVKKIEINNL